MRTLVVLLTLSFVACAHHTERKPVQPTKAKPEPMVPGGSLTPKPDQVEVMAFFNKKISEVLSGKFSVQRVWWYKAPCLIYFPTTGQCLLGLSRMKDDGCEVASVWTGNYLDGVLAHEMTHCALSQIYRNGDGEHALKQLWVYVEKVLPQLLPVKPKLKQWTVKP